MTDRLECRVFYFIFYLSEVNEFLILRYFVCCGLRLEGMPILLEFSRKLAWQIINNIYIGECGGGGVLAIPHSSVDDCTKAREKISESEMDFHCKNFL